MQGVTTIGLDIAKSVFRFTASTRRGTVITRRQLKRRYVLAFFQRLPPCLVGLEACASSHHWSRELKTLGHTRTRLAQLYGLLRVEARRLCARKTQPLFPQQRTC